MDKEKELLQQIANMLFINTQRVNQYGLLQGKLGIAIFFYHYARYTGDERYNDFPNEYVEYIYEKLGKDSFENFADGLSGIGWGIDYIIKEGFVDADDDMLEKVDEEVIKIDYSDFVKEIELPIPLFSKGLYFIQRNNKGIFSNIVRQIDIFFQKSLDKQIPMMYINSIVYFLLISVKQGVEVNLCKTIVDKIFNSLRQSVESKSFSDMDNLLMLQKNISLMDDYDAAKWEQIVMNRPFTNDMEFIHNISYLDFLFSQGKRTCLDINELYNIMPAVIKQPNYGNLSIYCGLASVGIKIMRK